jgi:hypothetical protein
VKRKVPDLRDLVGEEVTAEELARLGRVHDLLVRAGPPPELPSELAEPPEEQATVVALVPKRHWRPIAALAPPPPLPAFGVGWLAAGAGDSGGGESFAIEFRVPMQGTPAAPHAVGSIAVGELDSAGNWPMAMTVRGLPALPDGERYELWLTKGGKLLESCGTFRTTDESVVFLNAPFKLRGKGWAVTRSGQRTLLLRTTKI